MVIHDLSWDYMKIKNDLRGSLMDMCLQKLGENEDEKKNVRFSFALAEEIFLDCTQDCSCRHKLTFSAVATVLTSSVNSL